MKKLVLVLFAAGTLVACKENKKTSEKAGEVAEAAETSSTYTVGASSTIGWTGKKVVDGSHNGTISIKEGSLSLENGELTAGNFTIDMTTIANTDIEDEEKKGQLIGHLSSPDFFNVDSFSTATFEITKVAALEDDADGNTHTISGNLTIKGNSREINFPAKVTMEEDKIITTATTEINRMEWNVSWGNKDDATARERLKDNFLSNMIGLEINLIANKD